MNSLENIIKILQNEKQEILGKYGVRLLGIFGSYVRNEQTSESDIDILVEILKPVKIGLYDYIKIIHELSQKLNIKVNFANKNKLKPHIGKYILKEVVNL